MINDLQKLRIIYKLKNVERMCSVQNRKESSAEHSWSSLILADFLMKKISIKLDKLKVYELLMYHDLVEIIVGDICITKEKERENKKEVERKASKVLATKLPQNLSEKYFSLFEEYEEGKTIEAKFAKAIDALDPQIHQLDHIQDWVGWTEEFLRRKKGPLIKDFPELKILFEELMTFQKKNGYFDQ